ncbi:MAG: hypothetical protein IKW77_12335 [Salinivirgaceae bacterium]|nr:hypothetical protein [Salinivirgaceae bacterium]
MKTTKQLFLATALCFCSLLGAKAAYNGTPVTPQQISSVNYATYGFTSTNYSAYNGWYAISTAEELYGFAALVNNGNREARGVLTADIVVNENVLKSDGTLNGTPTYSWTPIGTEARKFAGKFDGQGHTVSGLYFRNTIRATYPSGGSRIGLFGIVSGLSSGNKAEISNVGVVDTYFYGSYSVAGICGTAYSYSIISNCYNTGTINGTHNIGGICGWVESNTTIIDCYNAGMIRGSYRVGGVCGQTISSSAITITDCYYLEGCAVDGRGVVQNGIGSESTGQTTPDGGNMSSATAEELGEMIANMLDENNSNGMIWIGDVITVIGDWVVTSNFVVPAGTTLNIPEGASVTIIEGVRLVNEGIVNNNGTIIANGTISGNNLAGSGQFIYNKLSNADVILSATSYTYKGTAYTLGNGINATINNRTFCGKQFTFDDTGYTVSYENNRNAGNNAKIIWTGNSTIEKTFTINPKTLTVSATANNKVYDGITTAAGTVTPSGIVNGDNVTISYSSATFNDKNVGTGKPVTFNITKSGADAGNYTVATTATATANITAKTLTVSATANNKVYEGTTTAAGTVKPSGIINGDNVTVSYSSATFNDKNVGSGKSVTFNITKNGGDAGNYIVATTATATANITAKTLTVSATANNKVYDGTTTAAGTVTPSGIVNGDNVTVSYSSATFNDKNVGTGKPVTFNITKSGSDAGNYTVATTATSAANITAKTLAVSATANNKVYDGTTTAAGTVTPSGIINGDNVTVSYSSATFNDKNVGAGKPVTFNITKSGSDAGNYTVATTAMSAANITPNTNVTVTITGNSNTVTYNTEEQIISGYTVDIDDAIDVYTENDIVFIGMATVSGTIAGTYSMGLSADDFSNTNTNFADVQFVVTDGVLTINKAENAPDMPTTIETYYINTQRVALPDNWQWVENIALEKGENTATAQYFGADAGNYENESVDVVITRTACPHDEGYAIINTVEPSCTKEGYTGDHLCNICNEIFEQGESIEAHGHTNGEAVFENTVVATCTAAGSRESVVYCTVCQAEVSRSTLSIPALGHTEVVDAAVAATCTTVGKTEGKHCSVCNAVIVAQTEIAALGHKFENYIYNNDVTTTADGTETATCEHGCGATDTRVAEGTLLPDDTFISESNTDQVNIYTIDNAIVVENATDEIFVYNAMGALVYKNSVYNVPVMISINRSGIYIVKTSGTVKRVMVN